MQHKEIKTNFNLYLNEIYFIFYCFICCNKVSNEE